MAITLKLSTSLRSFVDGYDAVNGLELGKGSGKSIAQVINELGIPSENVKIIMVNGLYAKPDRVLADGDRLGLYPGMGGG